jgi:hypothetical protein
LDSTCLAKANHSWIRYNTEHLRGCQTDVQSPPSQHIGQLILVMGNRTLSTGTFAVINVFNVTNELDLGLNPVLVNANHLEIIPTQNVLQVVNVQHFCTNICHPELTGQLRKDLRQFIVPEAFVVHE